jgi:DNA-binding NarL/FixJ family response regulator
MNSISPIAKIQVFLVDDHPIVRRGLQLLIGLEKDIEVCGESDNGHEALQKIMALQPDVAMVDLSLKTSTGLDLMKQLQSLCPQVKILVFSMRDEAIYAERSFSAGASGYITKEEGAEKAIAGIRALMAGEKCMSPRLRDHLINRLAGPRVTLEDSVLQLSDRQLEVLELLGNGNATRDVAARLKVSIKTVESHRENIKQKLGLKTASELVSYAHNWVRDQQNPEQK